MSQSATSEPTWEEVLRVATDTYLGLCWLYSHEHLDQLEVPVVIQHVGDVVDDARGIVGDATRPEARR